MDTWSPRRELQSPEPEVDLLHGRDALCSRSPQNRRPGLVQETGLLGCTTQLGGETAAEPARESDSKRAERFRSLFRLQKGELRKQERRNRHTSPDLPAGIDALEWQLACQ